MTKEANFCNRCCAWLTYSMIRVQWGRLKRAGLSDVDIEDLSPRCQKCTTVGLRVGGTEIKERL